MGGFFDLPGRGRHFVYHLCAPVSSAHEDVTHVYVGVTNNLQRRLRQHSQKWWFPAVDLRLSEFIEYPTRDEAVRGEAELIRYYQPAVNKVGLR